jgi:ribosomal protein S15P/S13E
VLKVCRCRKRKKDDHIQPDPSAGALQVGASTSLKRWKPSCSDSQRTGTRSATILRDQYAIPLVKPITGKSISDILEAAGMAPSMPEDLANLIKKAQGLAVHMDKNKKDLHNKRSMQVIEARIHKLSRYYKRQGVLPENWKYKAKVASIT